MKPTVSVVLAVHVAIAAALLAAAPSGATTTLALQAVGPAHHQLFEDDLVFQTCEGNGVASVSYSDVPRRLLVAVADDDCAPTWSLLSGCQGVDADGTFHCHRHTGGTDIDATLTADGVFEFRWLASDFVEHIWGNLTRLDVDARDASGGGAVVADAPTFLLMPTRPVLAPGADT